MRIAADPAGGAAAGGPPGRIRAVGFAADLIMSAFTPTQWTLEPQGRPDNLSAAVLHSLSRPITGRMAWGPLKSFILGGLTFGILPLISWPKRFGKFVVAEQQQLWHFVEWLRIRTGDADAAKLRDSVRDTGAIPTLRIIPLIALIVMAMDFVPMVQVAGLHRTAILHMTYRAEPWLDRSVHSWNDSPYIWLRFYKTWIVCLSIAYFSHWLHVHQHVSEVNRLLRRLNPILLRQHLPPMAQYGVGVGLRPFWLLAGFIGVAYGAWWAIPAALAGAIHQRYCRRTSNRLRSELALRAGALLQQQRPAIDVPTPHGFRVVCNNRLCGKSLPGSAAFCPRCGSRLPSVDAVA